MENILIVTTTKILRFQKTSFIPYDFETFVARRLTQARRIPRSIFFPHFISTPAVSCRSAANHLSKVTMLAYINVSFH